MRIGKTKCRFKECIEDREREQTGEAERTVKYKRTGKAIIALVLAVGV